MLNIYDQNAPKKPTNLSLNSDLLKKARALNINLSSSLEEALAAIVKQRLNEQWLTDNQEAVTKYNEQVATNGVFSDDLRGF